MDNFRVWFNTHRDEYHEEILEKVDEDDENGESNKKKYIKKWSDEDYKKFYEAVELFKESQLSNKKIAKYMGDHIDPM